MPWDLIMFAGAAAAVLGGCLVPNAWLPPLPNDKLLHFAAYFALAGLAARLATTPAAYAWTLLGLLVAGWLVECLQQLVPGRGFSWRDQAANAAGIACAGALVWLWRGAAAPLAVTVL